MDHDEISITPTFSDDKRTRRVFEVRFSGRLILTTVTRRATVVRRWISNIFHRYSLFRRRFIVGLGVQWRPKSSRKLRAATLQLSVGNRCLIFQIGRAKHIPRPLRRFLEDDLITFAGVGIGYDVRLLGRRGLTVTNPEEIRELAKERMKRRNASMAAMEDAILDGGDSVAMVKTKRIGMSNWELLGLSPQQILYASVDAQVSYRLALRLIRGR